MTACHHQFLETCGFPFSLPAEFVYQKEPEPSNWKSNFVFPDHDG